MKLFKCSHCGQLLYFENYFCESCGHKLGFWASGFKLDALTEKATNQYQLYNDDQKNYKYCANQLYNACNWLLPAESDKNYCEACQLNQTIPYLNDSRQMELWKAIEIAKHRLVYSLLKLKLPLIGKNDDQLHGLAFNFLSDENQKENVQTGHENGLITININEADDLTREKERQQFDEPYRTLLGHLRHEIGHYYWDVIVDQTPLLIKFRSIFGDERIDYQEALRQHYQNGPPNHWNQQYISAYASTHPWEDWAETWAHYLHILDTLETAYAFGLNVAPRISADKDSYHAEIDVNPYNQADFEQIINWWLPLTFAMNSLSRGMGLRDVYPFVIPPAVIDKLSFIHNICYPYHPKK